MIRIRIRIPFFLEGAASSSRLLIYFKYNNYIQDNKLVLEERKSGFDGEALKG